MALPDFPGGPGSALADPPRLLAAYVRALLEGDAQRARADGAVADAAAARAALRELEAAGDRAELARSLRGVKAAHRELGAELAHAHMEGQRAATRTRELEAALRAREARNGELEVALQAAGVARGGGGAGGAAGAGSTGGHGHRW